MGVMTDAYATLGGEHVHKYDQVWIKFSISFLSDSISLNIDKWLSSS